MPLLNGFNLCEGFDSFAKFGPVGIGGIRSHVEKDVMNEHDI